jgi:hypothetical protein
MDCRKLGSPTIRQTAAARAARRSLVIALIFCAAVAFGCGAPGEPTPPTPPIPVAVTDLAAHQAGDGVELVFTLPTKTVLGDRLAAAPAVEVLRGGARSDGSMDAKSFRTVHTIPGSLVEKYVSEGQVKFTDPVEPAETREHAGTPTFYTVRTRAAQKRASADSNTVEVRMHAVPERISPLNARITEAAIELNWAAPTRTSAGDLVGEMSGYRVYRGEVDPSSVEPGTKNLAQAKWKTPLSLLAASEETSYRDMLFDFGKTYAYIVRSVVLVDGKPLESSDSDPTIVTPRDIFPPGPPQDVIAAILQGATAGSVVVELSWSINLETDLAGYRVYRSEQQGTRGSVVTTDLLLAPAYRDTSVEPGRRYWYTVTAVDRAGNESEPGAVAAVDVAKPPS